MHFYCNSSISEWERVRAIIVHENENALFFLALMQSLLHLSTLPFIFVYFYDIKMVLWWFDLYHLTYRNTHTHTIHIPRFHLCINKLEHWHNHNLFIDFHHIKFSVLSIEIESDQIANTNRNGGFGESHLNCLLNRREKTCYKPCLKRKK